MERSNSIKVFITGATGNTGSATIKHLIKTFPSIKIMACVRDINKAKQEFASCDIKNLEYCLCSSVMEGSGAREELIRNMRDCGAALIVPPAEGRVEIDKMYVDCAKQAGVGFLAMISVASIGRKNVLFHRQFSEIENYVKQSQIRHVFLRCEFFMDNHLGDAKTVKTDKAFYYPVNPDMKFTPIAVCDVGAMASTLMVRHMNPLLGQQQGMTGMGGMGGMGGQSSQFTTTTTATGEEGKHHKHHSMVYHLTGSKPTTMTELASIYSKLTKTDVKYVQVSRNDSQKAMIKMGFPEWQVEGVLELWDMVNEGMCQHPSNDVELVLGKKATTVEEFFTMNSKAFTA